MKFKSIEQLVDASDPSSLPNKELSEFGEETIWSYMNEIRVLRKAGLIIGLPKDQVTPGISEGIPPAIRRHFSFRTEGLEHDLRLSFRSGMASLLVALINAAIAVLAITLSLDEVHAQSLVGILILGTITILNWVTVWDTYEHFIYEYVPLGRKLKFYKKISEMEILVEAY